MDAESYGYSSLYYVEVETLPSASAESSVNATLDRQQVSSKESLCSPSYCLSSRCKAYKNVCGLSISFILTFGSFLGILSLQSSINASENLGLKASATIYGTFIVFGFLAPGYVRLVGTKLGLLSGYAGFLIYTLANYHPSLETLIPGSVVLGIFYGPTWVSLYSHSTTAAVDCSPDPTKQQSNIILFASIIAMSAKIAGILGNLISSLVLMHSSEANSTGTGNEINASGFGRNSSGFENVCDMNEAGNIDRDIYLILISVYTLLDIIAIIVVIVVLDRYNSPLSTTCSDCIRVGIDSPWSWFRKHFLQPLKNLLKTILKWRMLLLLPMFFINGLLLGFTVGTFSQVYISDCFGVQNIGFVLVSFGVGAGIASFISGKGVKYIPQPFFIYFAILVGVGVVAFLISWTIRPTFGVLFGVAIGLGVSEGIVNALAPGTVSVLFRDSKESAIATFQLTLAIGYVTSFTLAIFVEAVVQMWLIVGVWCVFVATYTVLIVLSRDYFMPCLSKCARKKDILTLA